MKAIITSINPKWVEMIASGKKTVEVRKTAPKEVPFKSYIYCTQYKKQPHIYYADGWKEKCITTGKVVGEYIVNRVDRIPLVCSSDGEDDFLQGYLKNSVQRLFKQSCLTHDEIIDYLFSNDELFEKPHEACFEHISDLVIYDKPKELREFMRPCAKVKNGCENCKYSVNEELPFAEISVGCDRRLTRPPQSWCYVEELK